MRIACVIMILILAIASVAFSDELIYDVEISEEPVATASLLFHSEQFGPYSQEARITLFYENDSRDAFLAVSLDSKMERTKRYVDYEDGVIRTDFDYYSSKFDEDISFSFTKEDVFLESLSAYVTPEIVKELCLSEDAYISFANDVFFEFDEHSRALLLRFYREYITEAFR